MLRSGTWSLKEESHMAIKRKNIYGDPCRNVIDWPHQHLEKGHKLLLQFLYQFQFSIAQSSYVMKESSTAQDLNYLGSTRLRVFLPGCPFFCTMGLELYHFEAQERLDSDFFRTFYHIQKFSESIHTVSLLAKCKPFWHFFNCTPLLLDPHGIVILKFKYRITFGLS